MTRRGGKEASVSSRGIGEDERQPVMARLAARWRRSNLVRLVALRKGNHLHQSTLLHQSTAASTWWCGPRPRLGWVEMAVGLPEGPSYPGHSCKGRESE